MIVRAFQRDFQVNGPSVVRIVRTTLAGYRRYKDHPDLRIRRRLTWDARELGTTFSAVLGAARWHYRKDPALRAKMDAILKDLYAEFGWKSRLFAAVGGRYVQWTMRREERRLAHGWTYEPPTFYEQNEPAAKLAAEQGLPQPTLFRPLTCGVEPPRPAHRPSKRQPDLVEVG